MSKAEAEVMAFQSFFFKDEIALLLTKYAGRWANFVKKNSEIFGKHSIGIYTSFATISEPLTPNLPC